MKIERSYPFLEFIDNMYKILAVIALIIGVVVAIFGKGTEVMVGLVGGFAVFIALMVSSQLLNLSIHIEENTRRIANLLDKDNIQAEPIIESEYRPGMEPTIQD